MMTNKDPQTVKLQESALNYITAKLSKTGKADDNTSYPLNRGDILILIMLINQGLQSAPSDWTNPLNEKRLTAIREKLGNLAFDAPQMSKTEAQLFRE
jgi:hypothetical protein